MKARAEERIEYSRELVEYLRRGTIDKPGPLDELIDAFAELVQSSAFKFPVVCFYETRHTNFSAVLRTLPRDFAQTEVDKNGHGIVSLTRTSRYRVHLLTCKGCREAFCLPSGGRLSCIGL